jgi:predicted dehydrogenase
VGVVGTGFGVRVQIPVWQSVPGVRVTAVCSQSQARAGQVARRLGVPHALDDPAALAALDDVDLVSVTTPPHLHRAGVLAALDAGKHVLCEKPFALDAGQAREMLERAQARGVLHLVNFEFRRLPARQEVHRLIAAGYLGELRHVTLSTASHFLTLTDGRGGAWWFTREAGGGWLGAACSHDIDTLRFLFGEIVEVAAQLDTFIRTPRVRDRAEPVRSEVDDCAQLLLRFDNGAAGALLSSAAAGAPTAGGRLEACGSAGTLVLEGDRLLGARAGDKRLDELPVPPAGVPVELKDPHYVPFALWAHEIAAALRRGTPLRPDFSDGLRSQLVLDAARRAAAERRWVAVG